jgi:hypothetical protein
VRRDPVHFPTWTQPFTSIPLCCVKPAIFIDRAGERHVFEAPALAVYGLDGRYSAKVTFPSAGEWSIGVIDPDHRNERVLRKTAVS